MMEQQRELLSRHKVLATFAGIEPGREQMLRIYPPRPAKSWAKFTVNKYEEFEKPGKYGDEMAKEFAFVPQEADADVASTLVSLSPGDTVRLAWNHDYVTNASAGGGMTKSPERKVTLLERIEKARRPPPLARFSSDFFAKLDKNGDGSIDVDELCEALDQGLLVHDAKSMSRRKQAEEWMAWYDDDGNGALDKQKLRQLMADIDKAIAQKKVEISSAERQLAQAAAVRQRSAANTVKQARDGRAMRDTPKPGFTAASKIDMFTRDGYMMNRIMTDAEDFKMMSDAERRRASS